MGSVTTEALRAGSVKCDDWSWEEAAEGRRGTRHEERRLKALADASGSFSERDIT